MVRLNSDNFFDFLRGFCIIFLTYSNDRTHQTIEKKKDFSRIFLNILEFFGIFVRFLKVRVLDSVGQPRDIAQKIRLDLLHLLSYDSNHGETRGGRRQVVKSVDSIFGLGLCDILIDYKNLTEFE